MRAGWEQMGQMAVTFGRHRGASLAVAALCALILAGCAQTAETSKALEGVETKTAGTEVLTSGTYQGRESTETPSGRPDIIANPTKADLMVAGPLGDVVLGRADAPVTVIEYASLTCPYCRAFHKSTFGRIKEAYIDSGKVKWIIREFPIGRSSGNATIAYRCASEANRMRLFEAFLSRQAEWVSQDVRLDKIGKIAAEAGVTPEQFDSCLSNQTLLSGLNWVKERGRQLGVSGTPTFFIGETKVRSDISFEQFREAVEPQLGGQMAAAPAQ